MDANLREGCSGGARADGMAQSYAPVRFGRALCLLCFIAALLAAARARAEEAAADPPPIRFRQIELDLPGPVDAILHGRFTDGPFDDLLAVAGRTLYLYRADARLGYASRPTARVEAPADAVFVGGESFDGAPGLVFLGRRGVLALRWAGNAFTDEARLVIDLPTGIEPAAAKLPYLPFVEYAGDKRVVLAPAPHAIHLFDGGNGRPLGRLGVTQPGGTVQSVAPSLAMPQAVGRYPRPFFGLFTQAERTEAASYHRNALLLYRQGERGFGPAPFRRLPLRAPGVEPLMDERMPTAYIEVVDIDGDGATDLLLTQADKGRALVFLNTRPGGEALELHQALETGGWTLAHKLVDLDGSGRLDLVVVRVEAIGILEAVRILLTRQVTVDTHVYMARPLDGGGAPKTLYPQAPTFRRRAETPIVIGVDQGVADVALPMVQAVGADFDGRGLGGLLVNVGDRQLALYRGHRDTVFEATPARVLDIPALSQYKQVYCSAADLNGNGRDDIVLRYAGFGDGPGRVIVFLSVE